MFLLDGLIENNLVHCSQVFSNENSNIYLDESSDQNVENNFDATCEHEETLNNQNETRAESVLSLSFDHQVNYSNEESSFSEEYLINNKENLSLSLSTSLLCLFFAGKLSQSSVSLICEFSNLLTDNRLPIPKNFNSCQQQLLAKNSINFKKYWFCNSCTKLFYEIDNKLKNRCAFCNKR